MGGVFLVRLCLTPSGASQGGSVTLSAEMMSGQAFDVPVEADAIGTSVAAWIHKERGLPSGVTVQLLTQSGRVLEGHRPLLEALSEEASEDGGLGAAPVV